MRNRDSYALKNAKGVTRGLQNMSKRPLDIWNEHHKEMAAKHHYSKAEWWNDYRHFLEDMRGYDFPPEMAESFADANAKARAEGKPLPHPYKEASHE